MNSQCKIDRKGFPSKGGRSPKIRYQPPLCGWLTSRAHFGDTVSEDESGQDISDRVSVSPPPFGGGGALDEASAGDDDENTNGENIEAPVSDDDDDDGSDGDDGVERPRKRRRKL